MQIDPADPTPIRFLGELLRHEIGDWAGARELFERVVAMPADPISRAVALHGLGKMTIHEGRYAEGLGLFQRSLDAYLLPLTYRNLAVCWNSDKDHAMAHDYVKQALELDPDGEYNQIFAATYFVELGRPDEARAVAVRAAGSPTGGTVLLRVEGNFPRYRAIALVLYSRSGTLAEEVRCGINSLMSERSR